MVSQLLDLFPLGALEWKTDVSGESRKRWDVLKSPPSNNLNGHSARMLPELQNFIVAANIQFSITFHIRYYRYLPDKVGIKE